MRGKALRDGRRLEAGQARGLMAIDADPEFRPVVPESAWLAEYPTQRLALPGGSVELDLHAPGLAVLRLEGVLDLELVQDYICMLDQFLSHLGNNGKRCFLVADGLGIERLSFQAQRALLSFARRGMSELVEVHCALGNPVLRALLRLFEQVMPQSRGLLKAHASFEAALAAAKDRLAHHRGGAQTGRGPEQLAFAFHSEQLRIRYYQPLPDVLLCEIDGVLNAEGARHLLESHRCLLPVLRQRHRRVVLVMDTRSLGHTTIEAYRIFGGFLRHGHAQLEDLLCIITRHWPRAIEALTQRLLQGLDFKFRIVTDLPAALQAAGDGVPAAGQRRWPEWPGFGLRRRLRLQVRELEGLRQERERFLQEASQLLADVLLHKEQGEIYQISAAAQAGPYQELFESLYLLQSEYQEYLAALQQEIDERISAERDAAESSQIKSRFLANVSHELRTPLNAIIGFSNLLQRGKAGPLSQTQGLYVERVRDNSMHLLALINDVLDISKIESGTLHLHREPIQVSDLLVRVLEPLQAQARDKGLGLELNLDPGVPEQLCSDPDRLRQIVANFVGNALKFTVAGKVSVTYRDWPSPSHPLALEVSDTGIGIAPEDQKRIFEAFTQLHASSYPGAGLGLSICLNLAYALGCRLELESEPGQGSLFRLLLPEAMLP